VAVVIETCPDPRIQHVVIGVPIALLFSKDELTEEWSE